MKKCTLICLFFLALIVVCSCSHGSAQPEVDPQAVADSARAAEIAANQGGDWSPETIERLRREDSLIRAGYERAGGEDVYNRWLPTQERLFQEFKKNRTVENKRKLMDFIAEHKMCLIVPKPFTKEMLAAPPVNPHPMLIMWDPDELSEYLDLFMQREMPQR